MNQIDFTRDRHGPEVCGNYPQQHCVSCDVDELLDEKSYQLCWECNHVYQTKEDLLREYLLNHPDYKRHVLYAYPLEQVQVSAITFCPLCLHDW